MKLDQLHYFAETARRQHLGQAAKFLNISPSAISHSIATLEQELGKTLFEKQGRQIRLTHHGKLLLDRADFLLSEVDRVREELLTEKVEWRGHYRIATTNFLCGEYLTPVWMKIQSHHPGLLATLISVKSSEVLSKVNAGEVDLGICFSPYSGPQHEQETLHEGSLVIAMGKNHPFLKDCKIENLNRYPTLAPVVSHGIENCETPPSFLKFGLRPKVLNYFDSYDTAIQALKFNTIWTLLPDFIAQKHSHIKSFQPKGWDAHYRLTAVWPKYRLRTQALDLVVHDMKVAIAGTKKAMT